MKRAQEKIKDFVEPQAFEEVKNVAADLARALAAYRFTDVTSELLTRWLDTLADLPKGQGTARSLAGPRGVGKSHTLAVFGAMVGFPNMRFAITDAQVATSARRLTNRRYQIIRVERGTRPTLLEEIVAAFSASFGGDQTEWSGKPDALIANAISRTKGGTLVIIIDTAFGRSERVRRDDGPLLAELAVTAQKFSTFIALALDDDITDASGPNAALSRTFQIDYLDPEHLYHVVDLYLLRKNAPARLALHDIYLNLRSTVPGFNWSEPRFTALYPMHPLVADAAAAVRLYAPQFALLPFAAEAATRALGRPAASLVLLDEVFDHIERDLRRSQELQETFAVYDELATKAVPQFPARHRLQAKLILKSLFILSLDGRGATARELCAALLFHDESSPNREVERVEEMLIRLAEAAPESTVQRSEDGGEARYRFQISAAAGFDTALTAAVEGMKIDGALTNDLLHILARARFDDWPLINENGETLTVSDFQIEWRGSDRPGRLVWQFIDVPTPVSNSLQYDWEVVTLVPGHRSSPSESSLAVTQPHGESSSPPISVLWQPAEPTAEEMMVLRRLAVLRSDAALVADFGDTARAAAVSLHAQAERIWARTYIDEGVLVINGIYRRFTEEARSAPTFTVALARTFAPLFQEYYPQHPPFTETLSEEKVTTLIENFFRGANAAEPSVQRLAGLFAAPLGLAIMRADSYTFETGDDTLRHDWIRDVLTRLDAAGGEVVPLDDVRRILRREPYGLLRPAQHLVLAALVAQRRIELVTLMGNRISHRTLDRSLKWEEVAGVRYAVAILYQAEELTAWARRLTNRATLASIDDPAGHDIIRAALSEWLDAGSAQQLLRDFDQLPDEALTLRAWNMAAAVRRRFGASADAIEAVLTGTISLEEGLQRVADAFLGSAETFAQTAQQLADLTTFVTNVERRERAYAYLATAEPTSVEEIDSARRELLMIAEDMQSLFDRERYERFGLLWREFHTRYMEYYASVHDKMVGAPLDRQEFETILHSESWREFEALSQLTFVNQHLWEEAESLMQRVRSVRCDLPVRQLLMERPTCACSFKLSRAIAFNDIPQYLKEVAELGRTTYRRTLVIFSKYLARALDALANDGASDGESANRARALSTAFAEGTLPALFTHADVRLITHATERMSTPPPVRVHLPTENSGLLTRDELSARLRQWLDTLPNQPALIEIVSESENSGQ